MGPATETELTDVHMESLSDTLIWFGLAEIHSRSHIWPAVGDAVHLFYSYAKLSWLGFLRPKVNSNAPGTKRIVCFSQWSHKGG